MKHQRTKGIILGRTDFGEADRIITFLTPDRGKLKAIAKGVRRSKSKLAGGLELFSVSDISFIPGRRDISTVVSTRLIKHYGHIVKDLDRTNTAYELIKRLDKATEDVPETEYFNLMKEAFEALDDFKISRQLIDIWFNLQLLRLAGCTPNLRTDVNGDKLQADQKYLFDLESMNFTPAKATRSAMGADEIKFLRLLSAPNLPKSLQKIRQIDQLIPRCDSLVMDMYRDLQG